MSTLWNLTVYYNVLGISEAQKMVEDIEIAVFIAFSGWSTARNNKVVQPTAAVGQFASTSKFLFHTVPS